MKGKSETCFGCNKLELEWFEGVSSCKNYVRGTPTPEENINKIKEILGIQEKIQDE